MNSSVPEHQFSHELRQPLTSIVLALWVLRNQLKGRLELEQWRLLEIVSESTDRLSSAVNNHLSGR